MVACARRFPISSLFTCTFPSLYQKNNLDLIDNNYSSFESFVMLIYFMTGVFIYAYIFIVLVIASAAEKIVVLGSVKMCVLDLSLITWELITLRLILVGVQLYITADPSGSIGVILMIILSIHHNNHRKTRKLIK